MSAGVLIAGGGLAAQRCCETLRKQGYADPIRVLCAEARAPYDRPPLSKAVLAGTTPSADVAFRPTDWYAAHAVELTLGRAAASLDVPSSVVVLDDGTVVQYEHLLVATGSEPRRLELLAGAANVHYLRTADDADRLHARLGPDVRLVVIGAGFIGQEVAATARGLGATVTVLEALPAPLSGIFGEAIGGWFADTHRRQGVDVHCSTTASHVVTDPAGRVVTLITGEGHEIPCDEVVVGIGVMPSDAWLYGSGLGGGHVGVEVDESGRTSVAGVFAAGDVARPFDPRVGAHVRTEHWESAARLGAAAARSMLGLEAQAAPLASFWSDQYGTRIQYLGYAQEADAMTVDGDPATADCAVTWTRAGEPVAALLIGRPRQMPAARRSIETTFQPILERTRPT
jgi:3-phenylpropionate/trans-cinnamate dioxygenase ferredoxin reductase subunit